ncbi:PREDICTED: katanin p60 ATPase-containing subunit A-like 2 [Nicrophorus vespilloides]|uniref:Katanin p60 ATPase-containing subunit A-like 2 n=1 Tax=Nicrophorus vespilloides TaxID=110193 RepID=A0ABM1M8A1_NICVS|nr:PREDICTED: katanin p60 ATPase-containing subunit A-like 2 [Nicrophorus vespilloides]
MSEYCTVPGRSSGNCGSRATKTHREYERNEAKERRRSLLYLIRGYLRDCNLHESADILSREGQLINQYELCDNIDLDIVLQDYQDYYLTKFNKMPRIVKRVSSSSTALSETGGSLPLKRKTSKPAVTNCVPDNKIPESGDSFQIDVKCLSGKPTGVDQQQKHQHQQQQPLLKPSASEDQEALRPSLSEFQGYTSEWREMADLITSEIVPRSAGIFWKDCIGLSAASESLKEAVVYPLERPELFTGLLAPWKGVLLFGPPGTGKTRLAKALAGESPSTFINLAISTFVSKWRGESEKMLKVLFDVARLYAPSTIFIDELDAIASRHEDHQHEASRRFTSELLIQLDGILSASGDDDPNIFVLATTNLPWNLGAAILRRFEKRILLNVPDAEARLELFRYYFGRNRNKFSDADYKRMAELTGNFSCAEIRIVCKEALMGTLREKLGGCCQDAVVRPVVMEDVRRALGRIRPAATNDVIDKYTSWAKRCGSS